MSDPRYVYLDSNATTPVRPEVLEAMAPYFTEQFGNPSSAHRLGRTARAKIGEAREVMAGAIGAKPEEIFFTSGGTESDNMAIKGYAFANRSDEARRIITSTIEHPAVLGTVKYLSKNGFDATYVDADSEAMVSADAVETAIGKDALLISIMHGNNEVGTVQPIKQIAETADKHGVRVHTDAVQTFLKLPINVDDMGVAMLSVSGHKVNGPKGVGALYVRKGTKFHSLLHGGHHERGKRAGTENVAGVAGFAKAVEIGLDEMNENYKHLKSLRDELEKRIFETISHVRLNGHPEKRTPNTLNMSFECVEGEAMLINLDMAGIAISTGSACSSGSLDPSHVLMAMGIPHEIIHGSLRFSFGHYNTIEDVDYVMSRLPGIVKMVREISPLWNADKGEVISLEDVAKTG